ncbi:gibberellin 2-beta-dioxygenase 6 [Cajanus cajan]|uniref:Gibberellin 2-beta-dioxygenase 8 n=1 Tax=Cajanus cajan TaxID=3821 RepID=A0A151RDE5_CAJCA|nr:gibberellin 2-beta-dioxygenase 6 [Cajanus cajan]KYP40674.1 Gibberellin 2-beta-dioxygenase 8 [Cajanus cajan]
MNNLESLPPILRQLSHAPPSLSPNDGGDGIHEAEDLLPVIDLECLTHYKNNIKLDEACKHWGLFRLVNHGVPSTLLTQLQNQAQQLFSLSYESKQSSCNATPLTYFSGTPILTSSGTALTRAPENINLLEGFNMPLGQLSQFQSQLPVLESFRLSLMEYGEHLTRIGTTLVEALMKNLDLKIQPSRSYVAESTGIVRVYRYPNSSNSNAGLGMEVHTDSSVLSILNQENEVSGLEVLKDDQWLTVKPISNTLIVNLGDMMQAISDDKYKSVTHRVKLNNHKERISICYFVFPDEDLEIESSKYRSFTYSEFRAQVQQDIKNVGHKVGLARFERT